MDSVTQKRGAVIEKFCEIEGVVDFVISQVYFGGLNKRFHLEVLYDEFFTLHLKTKILEKTINDKELVEGLRRLASIRNIFAHSRIVIVEPSNPSNPEEEIRERVPSAKNPKDNINYQVLYDEFFRKAPDVCKRLEQAFVANGGTGLTWHY